MKVILTVCHHEIAGLRFGKIIEISPALLLGGQQIFTVINGHREGVLINDVHYYEEGVAIVFCNMEDGDHDSSWDELVTWFQADPNWKQYGTYFETDGNHPDGPTHDEVLALLKS